MSNPPNPQPPRLVGLKRRRFVEAYLGVAQGCKVRAARIAGYSYPQYAATRLMRDPQIQAAVAARHEPEERFSAETLARLSDQFRARFTDYLDFDHDGGWTFNIRKARADGNLHLLADFRAASRGSSLILPNPLPTLKQLAKVHGITRSPAIKRKPSGARKPTSSAPIASPSSSSSSPSSSSSSSSSSSASNRLPCAEPRATHSSAPAAQSENPPT